MDHRWGLRFAVDTPVVLIYPAHANGTGRMTEVSMSGAFVRTDFTPPDLVWLHVAGAFEETEAYVVRHSHLGIAVEWVEFSPPPIRALGKWGQPPFAGKRGQTSINRVEWED
jgi:hypothetical protein